MIPKTDKNYYMIDVDEVLFVPTNPLKGFQRWGIRIGGKWCLDYTFRLAYGMFQEELTLDGDKAVYNLFDKYGLRYKDPDGKIVEGRYVLIF